MAKSLLASKPVQIALGALMGGYMGLVKNTTRWTVLDDGPMRALAGNGKGVVGAFWHGRLVMSIALWPKDTQPPAIIISRSADGDVIARAAALHGVAGIRGSSRKTRHDGSVDGKGAMGAFRAMVRHVEEGGVMAITPDGPKGPRMRVQAGALRLAETTGAPLIAASWSTRWRIVFKSWDRFILPLPFSRGVIIWSEARHLPANPSPDEREEARQWLESTMIELSRRADAWCGVEIIEPAPAGERRTR